MENNFASEKKETLNLENLNFEKLCELWLKKNSNHWKASTVAKYEIMLEHHLLPELGKYHLSEIDSDLISQFTNDLQQTHHLAEKTSRDVLAFFHKIISDLQAVAGTPSEPLLINYPQIPYLNLRVLTEEEQLQMMRYMNQDMDIYKFSVLLALTTGLRIGEICGLSWKDISLEYGFLKVNQTVQRIRNPDKSASNKTILQIDTPKTLCSRRTIPFTSGLLERIQRFQVSDQEAYLLTGTTRYAEPRTLQRKLKQYTSELQLQDVHFHTLRHTFATRCVEVGCDIKTLSEILGHSSITITMNRYVHPSIACKKRNLEKLNQAGFGC